MLRGVLCCCSWHLRGSRKALLVVRLVSQPPKSLMIKSWWPCCSQMERMSLGKNWGEFWCSAVLLLKLAARGLSYGWYKWNAQQWAWCKRSLKKKHKKTNFRNKTKKQTKNKQRSNINKWKASNLKMKREGPILVAETEEWKQLTWGHNSATCSQHGIGNVFEVSVRDPTRELPWRAPSWLTYRPAVLILVTHSSQTWVPMGKGNSKTCTRPVGKRVWIQELCTGGRAGECEKDFPILNDSQEAYARNEQ